MIRACRDCAHFECTETVRGEIVEGNCLRKLKFTDPDVISGALNRKGLKDARAERESDRPHSCGPGAQYFVPREGK